MRTTLIARALRKILPLVLIAHSAQLPAANADAARELLQATSLDRMLRADVVLASELLEALPDDLPPPLRSDIRQAIERNLDYARMQDEISDSVAKKLKADAIEKSLGWWSSLTGRAIADAESSVYELITSGRAPPPRTPAAADAASSAAARGLTTESGFPIFVNELLQVGGDGRECLLVTANLQPDCNLVPGRGTAAPAGRDSNVTDAISEAVYARYARLPIGDLSAYRGYLRVSDTRAAVTTVRAAMLDVERRHLQYARSDVEKAILSYARTTLGDPKEALRKIVADIDAARNLPRARFKLLLLHRADNRDPAVLVELARVALAHGGPDAWEDSPGMPPPVDEAALADATRWLDQAHALDPGRAETLVLEGHVAYLGRRYDRSIELLEEAQRIGTSNPWLRINLANAVWARGITNGDGDSALRAARIFDAALRAGVPSNARVHALSQLADIHDYLGNLQQADQYHRQKVGALTGESKGYALHRYSYFLLYKTQNVEASVSAAREALQLANFPLARTFLARVLLVQSGMLYARNRAPEAAALVAEARTAWPDLASMCSDMARSRTTFPGVRALHASGVLKNFGNTQGSGSLMFSSRFATAAEIEELIRWGADPNYLDPQYGTALHSAILFDNVTAVKTLLAHGANPTVRFIDGRAPSELTDNASNTRRTEILALVSNAAGRRGPGVMPTRGLLKPDYLYRVKKPVGGDQYGHTLTAGERVIFSHECAYADSRIACLAFKRPAQPEYALDVALEKDQLSAWGEWFEEIGPKR